MLKKIFLILILFLSTNLAFADTIKFAQITDVHLQKQGYISVGGRNLSDTESILRQAVRTINNDDSIEYVFFTGDSVDRSYKYLWENFFSIVNYINKPYFLSLGNHDINSPNGLPKKEVLNFIEQKSRYHQNSPDFVVDINEKFIGIMIDTTFDKGINSQGYIKKETLNWLDKILDENKDKYIIIFNHYPIVEPINDKKLDHRHDLSNKKELIKILKKHKNVILFLSGHYHLKGEFKKYGIRHFSTLPLYEIPNSYRIIEINYNDKKIESINTYLNCI